MGNCIYCDKPAGLFRSRHKECQEAEEARQANQRQLREQSIAALKDAARGMLQAGATETALIEGWNAAKNQGLSDEETRAILIAEWTTTVDNAFEDGIIDDDEQARLLAYLSALGFTNDDVNAADHYNKMVKGIVLRELFSGTIPERFSFTDNIPVNLQKGEKIVWGFPGTKYIETRTRIDRVGGSQGVSLRIMSGVYYRVGAFKSRPVEAIEHKHIDTGCLVITDKNIYFAGPSKSLRIPYGKIVSFDPYSDGIGIMRDAQTANLQTFVTGDGWFTYNLASNLAQR